MGAYVFTRLPGTGLPGVFIGGERSAAFHKRAPISICEDATAMPGDEPVGIDDQGALVEGTLRMGPERKVDGIGDDDGVAEGVVFRMWLPVGPVVSQRKETISTPLIFAESGP